VTPSCRTLSLTSGVQFFTNGVHDRLPSTPYCVGPRATVSLSSPTRRQASRRPA
jgi:hypothetical protein